MLWDVNKYLGGPNIIQINMEEWVVVIGGMIHGINGHFGLCCAIWIASIST